jgi:DNA-binding LacI/PurR family transcriptional regulator
MALRYEGLKKGFERTSGPAKVEYLEVADFSFETALQAVSDFMDSSATEMPDAIFAASDAIAMAALTCMQVRGIKVPDHVSLVGYDDMPAAALVKPALTTVRQDTREAANLLLEKLFQALDGGRPKSAMLPTELIVRET